MTWQQQLELHPELRDMSVWPKVPIDNLFDAARVLYARRQEAVGIVLLGQPVESAATVMGRSQNEIYRLLDRCLSSEPGETPLLNVGLLPEKRVKPYTRTADLGPDTKGWSGAFDALMRNHPEIFTQIGERLRKELARDRNTPILGPTELHRHFKDKLRDAGVKDSDYPFSTKGVARTSFASWREKAILAILAETNRSVRSQYDINWSDLTEVMDVFEFDEHHQDLNTSLLLDLGSEIVPVKLSRIWLIVLVEKDSEAIFGIAWGFSAQPRHDDFLACASEAITPWRPYDNLPPGLEYPAAAGHPSAIAALQHCVPYIVKMDNAWAHLANDVKAYLLNDWHCVVNWGRPAHPIARRVVELLIARLAIYEHQFPSTTGNSPFDRRRDPHTDKAPRVPIQHIAALFDVIRATLNTEPRAHLLNRSPMKVLEDRANNGAIFRRLLPEHRSEDRPHQIRRQVHITGNPRDPHTLHVNFAYGSYKCEELRQLVAMGLRKLNVSFDRRDIRLLGIVNEGGQIVGTLQVEGVWKRFPHDIRLRALICREARDNRASETATLVNYFAALKSRVHRPSEALRLLDVIRRISGPGWQPGDESPPGDLDDTSPVPSPNSGSSGTSESAHEEEVSWQPVFEVEIA